MAVASTSALQPADEDAGGLSLRQQLLLAQAVVKLGARDWTAVEALLKSVPTADAPPSAQVRP